MLPLRPHARLALPGALSLLLAVTGPVLGQEAATHREQPEVRWPFEQSRESSEGEERQRPEEPERPERRDVIETDRDSFTPAVTTAGRNRLIFESSYSFIDNRRVLDTHSFPEALLRYGVTDRLELRLGWNYEVGGAGNQTSGSGSGGEGDEFFTPGRLERATNMLYGVKYRINQQSGWVPGSSIILQGATPTSGPDNHTSFTGAYVFGWGLPGRSKLDASIRYRNDEDKGDHFNTWAPSVVLKVLIGERITVHAEYFGLFSEGKEREFVQHYFSPGVHYLITDDLEVGTRFGWGLNDQSARFFVNAGVGVRF
jgi:hypothetical protein